NLLNGLQISVSLGLSETVSCKGFSLSFSATSRRLVVGKGDSIETSDKKLIVKSRNPISATMVSRTGTRFSLICSVFLRLELGRLSIAYSVTFSEVCRYFRA